MSVVIVGAGLAGATTASELRKRGFTGSITLVGSEPHAPYERPPLSKDLLLGKRDAEQKAFVHEPDWYAEHDIDLLLDTTATALDLEAGEVVLADGRRLGFDHLVLATGSTPRRLRVADDSGAPVAYLRTLEDAHLIADHLTENVLVIGGGWIGLEVASAVQQAGGEATVVVRDEVPLRRVLGAEVAQVFADLHREHGVDLHTGATLASLKHTEAGTTATLDDGTELHPDLVVVGIGATPNVGLAQAAGLAVEDGVVVDAYLRASDPRVFAIGDIANHAHPQHGRLRVEHWDAAVGQGKHAARMITGEETPYTRQPYFFTDQYDLGMEYAGHGSFDDDVVVRGDRATRELTAIWLRENVVVAVMQANDWDAMDPLKAWLGHPATEHLRDPSVPLSEVGGPA
ncbi:NAD(P)/FAD-dependent oxidoreductase [Aestuariimicrobium soli]|uniref:NAD(P)/FAD-dependent oxidoreductase n=1 Tax=Aestuariimicrobium soli TaxID=2035834 RepID=UPI003EC0EB4B